MGRASGTQPPTPRRESPWVNEEYRRTDHDRTTPKRRERPREPSRGGSPGPRQGTAGGSGANYARVWRGERRTEGKGNGARCRHRQLSGAAPSSCHAAGRAHPLHRCSRDACPCRSWENLHSQHQVARTSARGGRRCACSRRASSDSGGSAARGSHRPDRGRRQRGIPDSADRSSSVESPLRGAGLKYMEPTKQNRNTFLPGVPVIIPLVVSI